MQAARVGPLEAGLGLAVSRGSGLRIPGRQASGSSGTEAVGGGVGGVAQLAVLPVAEE